MTLQQEIKLKRKYLDVIPEEKKIVIVQQISDAEKGLERLDCDPMPDTFLKLLEKLGNSWHKQYYPHLYQRFNNAIHLDIGSLCSKAKDDGATVSVTHDSTESIEELAKCWAFNMLTVFNVIRSHYGWGIKTMRNEYRAMNQSDDA